MTVSSIENSEVYHKVIPLVLISLSSLYVSILLLRYVSWRFRRRRAKQVRQYRRRLERFWKKHTMIMNADKIQLPTPTYSITKKQLPQSFDSSATLVVSAKSIQHKNHYVKEPQTRFFKEKSDQFHANQHQQNLDNGHQKNSRHPSLKEQLVSVITRDKFEKRQQKKRRQLLWQWSVAMGYCKYHHGHHLNTIIDGLLEKQNSSNSSSSSSSSSNSTSQMTFHR
jgi:hypothetical protein